MQHNRSPSIWWHFLVIALSFEILLSSYEYDTFSLALGGQAFIPVLTAALAWRYGVRVLSVLLLIAFLSALGILGEMELLNFRLAFYFGQPWSITLLATGTAVTFCRPGQLESIFGDMHRRWKTLRWLVLIALWFAVFKSGMPEWELSDSLTLESNPALVVLLALLAASIDWRKLRTELQPVQDVLSITRAQWFLVLGVLILFTLPFGIDWDVTDSLSIHIGFATDFGILIALCFLLPVFGLLDWRLTMVLAVVFFIGIDPALSWVVESGSASMQPPSEPASVLIRDELEEVLVSASLRAPTVFGFHRLQPEVTCAICACLLAAAMAPYWHSKSADSLQPGRTGIFLLAILLVFFAGYPITWVSVGWLSGLVLGGVAFVTGLVWSIRGMIAITMFIQLLYLLKLFAIGPEDNWVPDLRLVELGLLVFPFAFFGLLSRRMGEHVTEDGLSQLEKDDEP